MGVVWPTEKHLCCGVRSKTDHLNVNNEAPLYPPPDRSEMWLAEVEQQCMLSCQISFGLIYFVALEGQKPKLLPYFYTSTYCDGAI